MSVSDFTYSCVAFSEDEQFHAKTIMQYSVLTLMALCGEQDGNLPYIRAQCLALLQWSDWHEAHVAGVYSEEMCEAMLSRLARRCQHNMSATSVQAVDDEFVAIKKTQSGLKDKMRSNIPKSLVVSVGQQVSTLVSRQHSMIQDIPFATWSSKAHVVTPSEEWDEEYTWPVSLFTTPSKGHCVDMMQKYVITLSNYTDTGELLIRDIPFRKVSQRIEQDREEAHAYVRARMPNRYKTKPPAKRSAVPIAVPIVVSVDVAPVDPMYIIVGDEDTDEAESGDDKPSSDEDK
jgi:hypothetical protein